MHYGNPYTCTDAQNGCVGMYNGKELVTNVLKPQTLFY